jgi:60 kDa SS-A/Ro ribonucleoprotein
MTDALSSIRTRNTVTPQSQQADARQVPNSAGGFTFEVSGEDRIKRFLMLGTEGGSFYAKEDKLTQENAAVVIDWAKNHGGDLVLIIKEISVSGRAPRQNPALFALAAVFAFGNEPAKKVAQAYFNDIVRTGTHLFTFVGYADQFRGWGRALKRAVAGWYTSKDVNDLSYQMIKYRQRDGWTHNRLLDLSHPSVTDPELNTLLAWAVGKNNTFRGDGAAVRPGWVTPYEAAQGFGKLPKGSKTVYAEIIREHPGLPWEALPDVALTYPETWEALLDAGMPIGALLRNLSKLTGHGLLTGSRLNAVTSLLTNEDVLRKGRVHPIKILYALRTYAQGHGAKGSGTWTPVQSVVDALDGAFYTSFGTVEPAGKRTGVFLDVSGSMTWDSSKCGILTAREASAAMAMVTLASEPGSEVAAFSCCGNGYWAGTNGGHFRAGIERVPLSPRRRLDDNLTTIGNMYAGGTDCALPMLWAKDNKVELDTFVVYTDNETWAGTVHPHEALRQYRQATGINAKLVVAGMVSNGFTIADPSDSGMLDVCGFDANTPSVISGFSRGDFS